MFFLLYVYDSTNCGINSKLALFADDTSLVKGSEQNERKIVNDVNKMSDRYTSNIFWWIQANVKNLILGFEESGQIEMMVKTVPRESIVSN